MHRTSYIKRSRLRPRPYHSVTTRAGLIQLADILMSKYVRWRDGQCVCCGSTENLQAGHFYSRRYLAIRWDDRNVHAQCANCNLTHTYNIWPYLNFLHDKYGEDALQEIHELRMNAKIKVTDAQIQERIAELKGLLRKAA